MVALIALTGGALAAGFGAYQYFMYNSYRSPSHVLEKTSPSAAKRVARGNDLQSVQMNHVNPVEPSSTEIVPRTMELTETLQRGFNSASLSLGIASTGLLFLPPLRYASVPVLIYMGAPSARQAYDLLYEEGRTGKALAETVLLAICLGGGWYWIGSLGFCLYYYRQIIQQRRIVVNQKSSLIHALPQSARQIIDDHKETIVPVSKLQRGDKVLIKTSDVVPVDGIIAEGVAWVQPAGTAALTDHCLKHVGDQLMAADIVITGRLLLRVQKGT